MPPLSVPGFLFALMAQSAPAPGTPESNASSPSAAASPPSPPPLVQPEGASRPEGTMRMVQLLQQCTARANPMNAPYMNDVRVPLMRTAVGEARNPGEKRRFREAFAQE